MTTRIGLILATIVALLFAATRSGNAQASAGQAQSAAITCPTTSGNSYSQGIMFQKDNDNPVRHADHHADKNLALRGYESVNLTKGFVDYNSHEAVQPPQFATLFNPSRVPTFSTVYTVNNWNWLNSPQDGTRGGAITNPPVTALGLQTTPGETLRSLTHGYDLGSPAGLGGAMVIFADADSITLHFTRDDSAAGGFTVHVDKICTDPNLLSLYNSLDNSARNTYHANRPYSYNLPALTKGQAFGVAKDTEIVVAIVDTGAFEDPRSVTDWWQIAPATPTPTRTATGPTPTPTRTSTPTLTNTITPTFTPTPVNLARNKATTADSAPCGSSETSNKAVDGSVTNNSKWCSFGTSGQYWLQVDLGAAYNIGRFVVKHAEAGGESASYNTRDFQLQLSSNGISFATVVTVTSNTAAQTTHDIASTTARYVRLFITAPVQSGTSAARIYELEVYGATGPTATATSTATVTRSATATLTSTTTSSPTITNTPSRTATPTITTTSTNTPLATATFTRTPTATATLSPTTPPVNLALNKATTADSAPCGSSETSGKAVDGSVTNNSKWCSFGTAGQYWLRVDLGGSYTISRFIVKHAQAGGEPANYNTRDFQLQLSADGTNFTPVVTVAGNTAGQTTHDISPTSARYVRLFITAPVQSGTVAARIYELEVYGSSGPTATFTVTATITKTTSATPTSTITNTPAATGTPTRTATPTVTSTITNTPAGTTTPLVNVALNKTTTADSAACGSSETSNKAVDGSVTNNSKWCSFGTAGQYWLRVDLGGSYTISRFIVKHAQAGGEPANYNTRDFQLQLSADGTNFTPVVTVAGNTAGQTTHDISPTSARYVRLFITAPVQSGTVAARIYELEVYGVPNTGPGLLAATLAPSDTFTPTPTYTVTYTPTVTSTLTTTQDATSIPTVTSTPTELATNTPTWTATNTPTPTATSTSTLTPTPTPTPTGT